MNAVIKMRIGVFDSGLGGLTVLEALIKKNPQNEYVYFGDTLNIPYGDKSKEELLKLSSKIVKFLESKKVDIIVIACGTLSSNVYSELDDLTTTPIYDILSPTREFLENQKLNNLAVIATEMTIKSGVFGSDIISIACPKIVPLIEAGKSDSEEMQKVLEGYLKDKNIDNLVLGCTHYPLVKEQIKKIKPNINFIDMGEILAENLKIEPSKYQLDLYFSSLNETIKSLVANMFKDYKIEERRL